VYQFCNKPARLSAGIRLAGWSQDVAERKRRGELAEMKVATDLVSRGFRVAFPFGEDWDVDLIVCRGRSLERVQVKHVASDGITIEVRCYSQSLTAGRVMAVKHYTAETIDWRAVYDSTTDRCFYVPASELGRGARGCISAASRPSAGGERASGWPMTTQSSQPPKLGGRYGGVVVMGARRFCIPEVGVRFPSPPSAHGARRRSAALASTQKRQRVAPCGSAVATPNTVWAVSRKRYQAAPIPATCGRPPGRTVPRKNDAPDPSAPAASSSRGRLHGIVGEP
jgi:hypothetical protein